MHMKPFYLRVVMFCSIVLAASAAFVGNAVAQSPSTNFWKNRPEGPQVHGYFEGRSPCQEIIALLKAPERDECIKIKWQLLLFQDPVTKTPTTYALGGFAWRNPPKTGKWKIVKGTKEDPDAVVYQLDSDDSHGFLSFLVVENNLLFFLDKDRNLLVGNSRWSYTLNRVVKQAETPQSK
jgi:hypothetical protein